MKKILSLLFTGISFSSCCIVHKSTAQSDLIDTHRPKIPVVECIPCQSLRNVNENFVSAEVGGISGSYALEFETGHNFRWWRIYGAGSASWWPFRAPAAAFSAQMGIVGLDPDFLVRPEIGIGCSELFVKGNETMRLHPASGSPLVQAGNYGTWNYYAGLRFAVPMSNISLSLRVYRISTLKPKDYSMIYPGLVIGFRLF